AAGEATDDQHDESDYEQADSGSQQKPSPATARDVDGGGQEREHEEREEEARHADHLHGLARRIELRALHDHDLTGVRWELAHDLRAEAAVVRDLVQYRL